MELRTKTIRIALLGQEKVGKTAIIMQYLHNKFQPAYYPSIGETFEKQLNIPKKLNLEIVDTPGYPPPYKQPFPAQYTVDIDGYVLVYKVTSKSSFEGVKTTLTQLTDNTHNSSRKPK